EPVAGHASFEPSSSKPQGELAMIRLREIIVRRPNHAELGISRLRGLLIAIGVLGTIGSSLSVYPHQLAYFNEVAGGPKSGHKHLLHSNLDWGQDLLYLNEWVDKHPGAHPFHLAYYGYFDPRVVGLNG